MFFRVVLAAFTYLVSIALFAEVVKTPLSLSQEIQSLGPGAVSLDGLWQFHLGDDLAWRSPSYDDSGWESIDPSTSWGSQTHHAYTGFAWYRKSLRITSADPERNYALLMPPVNDSYDLYWNGVLVGQQGSVPPIPHWFYNPLPQSFTVPSSREVTIAIRVWKSPPLFVDSGTLGGLHGAPLLGDPDTISAQEVTQDSESIHQVLYEYTLLILYGMVSIFSLLLWGREHKIRVFLWLALFTATTVALAVLQGLFSLPISYGLGRGLNQPIYALNHVSLWFLLLWLLRLNGKRGLVRCTRILAICTLSAGVLDGLLAPFWGSAGYGMQTFDAILTSFVLAVQVYPILIILMGIRQRLDSAHWAVAISAFISQIIDIIADISAAGQRFTHWTLFERIINTPLFVIHGIAFWASNVIEIVLFVSILYAVYRFDTERQARQSLLEREMQSAREIQGLLIPEAMPSLEGYAVTSAYRPALEVGGDFFQIMRRKNGSTIVALGDVSGKGLRAAMTVSLIVGILRSLSDTSYSPTQVLQALNHCLCGRLQNGFVTAVILHLQNNGIVTMANAGHLPPFLSDKELATEGSLPLGLSPALIYEESSVHLQQGDQLSIYTDGLLEARDTTGELYGFDRLHTLFATHPTAQQVTEAAIAFGQNDDITVLTFTRLAEGEEATTSVTASFAESGVESLIELP